MRIAAVIALSFACAAAAQAEWLEKDQQTIRLDYVYADDVGSESADGVEIAFGSALYALDDVAVYFMGMENSDMDTQQVGLSVQEHFPIPYWSVPLIPYAGASGGYGWLDADESFTGDADSKKGGWVGRLEVGALLKLCDYFALNAGARFNYSNNEIFLEEDGNTESTQWNFAFGARFYY